jgi:hypothetical protein
MMKSKTELITVLILMGFTALIYAPYVFGSEFVVGDGALFYLMTEELRSNDYQIPTHTEYNYDSIPYAYPPLGFYVTAGLSDITGIDTFQLFRILPFLYTILTVP